MKRRIGRIFFLYRMGRIWIDFSSKFNLNINSSWKLIWAIEFKFELSSNSAQDFIIKYKNYVWSLFSENLNELNRNDLDFELKFEYSTKNLV